MALANMTEARGSTPDEAQTAKRLAESISEPPKTLEELVRRMERQQPRRINREGE
jgi:hypothetical protein